MFLQRVDLPNKAFHEGKTGYSEEILAKTILSFTVI